MEKIDIDLAKARWELRHVDEHLAHAEATKTETDSAVLKILEQISDWSTQIADHNR